MRLSDAHVWDAFAQGDSQTAAAGGHRGHERTPEKGGIHASHAIQYNTEFWAFYLVKMPPYTLVNLEPFGLLNIYISWFGCMWLNNIK